MKRIAVLILSLVLILLVTGCGSDANFEYSADGATTVNTTSTPTTQQKILLSDRLLSATEYHEEIKKLHPETAVYTLALEENDTILYTNTGSGSDFSGACMIYGNGAYMFSKQDGQSKYLVNYNPDLNMLLVMVPNNMGTLENAIADVTALLMDYPGGLTAEELHEKFQTEGQTKTYQGTVNSTAATTYEDTIHGVKYYILKSSTSVTVRLEFTTGYAYTVPETAQ